MGAPWEPPTLLSRLAEVTRGAAEAGLDALLISPGADLRYLSGYEALPLERLTCLVIRPTETPVLLVPRLEQASATASPAAQAGAEIVTWDETDDPYAVVASLLPAARRVAVDDQMWAEKVLALRRAMPEAQQLLAGAVLRPMRMRKSAAEVEALQEAATAIDEVHTQMGRWLRAGRSEREVGRDLADAIIEAGHTRVDIGGTTAAGYCSDSTRTYSVGEPEAEFRDYYGLLNRAQDAAVHSVRPGTTCAAVDAAAREVIAAGGHGEHFIHRTGHGIGLQTHEEPYIVAGNDVVLEAGMAFSIEPGIYLAGRHGARIEDIVVCVEDGVERLNRTPRDLVVL